MLIYTFEQLVVHVAAQICQQICKRRLACSMHRGCRGCNLRSVALSASSAREKGLGKKENKSSHAGLIDMFSCQLCIQPVLCCQILTSVASAVGLCDRKRNSAPITWIRYFKCEGNYHGQRMMQARNVLSEIVERKNDQSGTATGTCLAGIQQSEEMI